MIRRPLKFKWESIDAHTYRAKVPGGWIVTMEMMSNKGSCAITSQFVPDKYHEWKIEGIDDVEKNSPEQ